MTLKYDDRRQPVGLDWSVCTDGNERPEVWRQPVLKPNEPKVQADLEQAAQGRPAPQRIARSVERQIITMYRDRQMSALQISREVGVQSATVFKVLKRNNVPTRSRSEGMRLSRARRAQQSA